MLVLPVGLRRRIAGWATAGYPHETCGLLLGANGGSRVEVVEASEARNLNRERPRDRYELDPADYVKADARARELGLDVVGVWHSHPDHPARPSEADRAAAWSGLSYVIVAVESTGAGDLRSWRLNGESFVEERIETP